MQGDDFLLSDIGLEDTPKNDIVQGHRRRRHHLPPRARRVDQRRRHRQRRLRPLSGAVQGRPHRGLERRAAPPTPASTSASRATSSCATTRVECNVAGIEIENSTDADVYDNTRDDNTGGILVFNLPGLPVYGARTRVYDNQVVHNNTTNFAPAGQHRRGGADRHRHLRARQRSGRGLRQHDLATTTPTRSASSPSTRRSSSASRAPTDPSFDPFSESIYILDNTYSGGGTAPDLGDLTDSFVELVGGLPVPQIAYDGDVDPDKLVDGMLPDDLRFCVQDSAAPS